jgi:adenylate kinase family enzyme
MSPRDTSAKYLVEKLNFHICHTQSALEPYGAHDKIKVIDALAGDELVWDQLMKTIRSQPRSGGPTLPPRVVILGPRGVGAKEHASRLAFRLGAVFVDGEQLINYVQKPQKKSKDKEMGQKKMAVQIPNLETLSLADKMGPVGVRLRQQDCRRQGWVLFGYPTNESHAMLLKEDEWLTPLRVVLLQASEDACVQRLRFRHTDPVTGKVWTQRPKSDRIRRRLVRDKRDEAEAVRGQHREYMANAEMFRETFGQNGQCIDLEAEGDPAAVHSEICEFVERPLPTPGS